jgi:hypothetical protein
MQPHQLAGLLGEALRNGNFSAASLLLQMPSAQQFTAEDAEQLLVLLLLLCRAFQWQNVPLARH